VRVLYWAGQIYARLMEAAVNRLTELAPESPNLLRLYARGFDQKGQHTEAVDAYEKAIALGDHDPSLFIEYANFCSRGREFAKVIALLSKAIALAPYDGKLRLVLAEAYVQNGQPLQAVPYFRKILATDANNRTARLELAQALHTLDQTHEAIAVLQAAPSDPDGRIAYTLATFYARLGQREKAKLAMQVFQQKKKSSAVP
jgi:tetratricopeptide (TPR) repeat protein